MTAHEYIVLYGEEFRILIVDALAFLDEREPGWFLDEPINREEFIAGLVGKAS